ncbi:class I adenylate-forming enzyme family protein [Geodermatophilus sp. SYSU D01106]
MERPDPSRPTFAALWAGAVREHAGRPFLVFEDEDGRATTWTYAEFDALVTRTAAGLAARGVGRGDRVLLVLPNCVAFVAVWLACAVLGATFSSSDPRARAPEIAHQHGRLRPRLVVCGPDQAAQVPAGDATLVVPTGPDGAVGGLAAGGSLDGAPAAPPAAEDDLSVLFTSGTTSAPKGVVVSQGVYAHTGRVMAEAAGLGAESRFLVALPLFHANAQYYCFAAAVAVGASVALVPAFSATRYLAQLERLGATHASLFAAPLRMVLARGGDRPLRRPLEHMWFAQDLTADEYAAVSRLVGCAPRQLYGMTETGPAVLSQTVGGAGPAGLGGVTPGCAVRLGDLATGTPLVPPAHGEIQVGGVPGRTVFTGYLDDPHALQAVLAGTGPDGEVWFRTGDRAAVGPDGTWSFAGRGSEQLKVAGENVSAVEIEQVIARHPGVFEVAVTGRPDPLRTEVPVAHVVPAGPAAADLAASVLAWCAEHLSPAKRPHEVHVVPELPRTSVGKIRKFLLTADRRPEPGHQEAQP